MVPAAAARVKQKPRRRDAVGAPEAILTLSGDGPSPKDFHRSARQETDAPWDCSRRLRDSERGMRVDGEASERTNRNQNPVFGNNVTIVNLYKRDTIPGYYG
jgi:hypothetical protein